MDDYPCQPTLLTLEDMLNLSEDDKAKDDDWSSNPYSIHNFFEPIISPVKNISSSQQQQQSQSSSVRQSPKPGPSSGPRWSSPSSTNNVSQNQYVDPFSTPPKRKHHPHPSPPKQQESASGKLEPEAKPEFHEQDDFIQYLDVDMFDEALVNDELWNCEKKAESVGSQAGSMSSAKPLSFSEPEDTYRPQTESPASNLIESDDEDEGSCLDERDEFIFITPDRKGPKLEEVQDTSRHAQSDKCKMKRHAINQLQSLITILKRYSNLLEEFLVTEGDLVLEHYSAQTMLSGILPEMANESEQAGHPFEVAHSISKVFVDHVNGQTVLSTLPPRRSHLWRTSELLMLQMAVLESAIARKEFLINCRYTDLLTQMGFDADDVLRLKRNPTKQMELGTLKIILNEHEFLNKSRFSKKSQIRNVIVRPGANGGHRALILPSPERLVEDKWKALTEIRRRTVLSNLKDEDIDWLFVLKKMWIKNPKLQLDETACKLTYDHFISFKSNRSAWQVEEIKKLQSIREKFPNASWSHVASRLGTNRTPFSCFIKYKAHCVNDLTSLQVSRPILQFMNTCYDECKGNVAQLDHKLLRSLPPATYKSMKPRSLFVLFRKTLNPRLKKGNFSVVEDAALFATMAKYKKYLLDNEGMMDPISYALPWRNGTRWRMRFGQLLTTFFHQTWTLEEDKCLLSLVDEYGPNYKIIQRSFPNKDRKQCRSHYLKLVRITRNVSLEEYHIFCSSKREGLRIKRLDAVAGYLNLAIRSKLAGNVRYLREMDLEFLKLRRVPREGELDTYLMTFPVSVLISAFDRLSDCLLHVMEKWKEIKPHTAADLRMSQVNFAAPMTGFNRRTFDPDCPASVASALHLRNAELLPQDILVNLSPFEENVYNYYKYFSLRSRAKRKPVRCSIPTLDALQKLTRISRLIEKPTVDPDNGNGMPAVIMSVKSKTAEDIAKEEAMAFQTIENKKLGGRLKGSKRKKTHAREMKQKAAMIRWERKKLIQSNNDYENEGAEVYSPWSTDSEFLCPSTPSSVASCSTVEGSDEATDCASSADFNLRRTLNGMISDHAYILPMQNPHDFSSLPLSQLFALLGHQRSQLKLRERNENS